MNSKGIDNVRGGSFSQIELSDEQIELINKMLRGANDECFNCGKSGHFSKECIQEKLNNYLSKINENNIDQEIEKINKLLQLLNNINQVIEMTDQIGISDLPEFKKDYMIINKFQKMNQELEKLKQEVNSHHRISDNTRRKIDNVQRKIRTFQQENHQVNGQSRLINMVRIIIHNLHKYERTGYLKLKTIYMENNQLQALEIITLNLNEKMKLKNIFKDYYNKEFIENYLSELYKLKISYLEESLKFNI
tara:strand:- start:31 stop:777 length:747 start_codon:yes stop_codon:yes gene_type:complete